MSLFVINRYEEDQVEKPDFEENHLLQLQKRIAERKREKELAAAQISKEPLETEKATKRKKSKKGKNKDGFELNETQNTSIVEELGDYTVDDLDLSKISTNGEAINSFMEADNGNEIVKEVEHLKLNGSIEAPQTVKVKEKKKKRSKNAEEEINEESRMEVDEEESLQSDVMENQLNKSTKKKKKKEKKLEEDMDISIESLDHDDLLKARNKLTKLAEDLHESDDDSGNERQDFTILKTGKPMKGEIVKRVLPDWLANPEVVSSVLNSGPSLEEIKKKGQLDLKLVEILESQGFDKLFPIQAGLLTWLLKCNENMKKGLWARDTCVSAPTGSGKTLAYVLPIVEILRTRFIRKIRCLIVLPVQELAAQVFKVIQKYASHSTFEHTRLKVGLVSGAASFEKEQEELVSKDHRGNFISRVDILVSTPRRLIDHIHRTPGFSLNDLQFLVIDEADRETFDWLQELPAPHSKAPTLTLNNLLNNPMPAQKLLFSATLSQDPEKLSRLGLFHPILYTSAVVKGSDDDLNLDKEFGYDIKEEGDAARYTSPTELTIRAIECAEEHKPLAVYDLLTKIHLMEDKTLIFTNSCNSAHRLTLLVKSLLKNKKELAAEMSGQMNSKRREQEYQKFFQGETRVLICSDVLARGVDIPGIKLVISYDPPKHIESFIHRAGRTGRAGVPGTAVFLLIPRQISHFKKLLTDAKRPMPEIELKDFTSLAQEINYETHIHNLKESLEKERIDNLKKRKSGNKF